MKKKAKVAIRKTLREGKIIPITDPAIQAALDHMRRQAKPVVPAILREFAKENSRKGK